MPTAFDLAIRLIVYSFLREVIVLKKETEKFLYSFDIFDTLVTRKVATPTGIFALMQEKIQSDESFPKEIREDFYTIRTNSEKFVRDIAKKQSGYNEISFDDIYFYIQQNYKLSLDNIQYLKQLEFETERENLVPINENIQKVKSLVEKGERVVLISDMYYSSEVLRKLLLFIDTIFDSIKIYVSADYKLTKWDKNLYEKVRQEEAVEYSNWKHIGDNEFSDFKNAKSLGIKAKLYDYPNLLQYEKDILKEYPDNAEYQLLVGSARLTRLNGKIIKNRDKYAFGASFAGPFLYNYVSFILKDCIKKGYRTLYFVARDGYIPKIIADIIINKLHLKIKTKYIYGSRMAWRIPNEKNYIEIMDKIFTEYPHKLSAEYIAYRTNIPAAIIRQKLNLKSEKYRFKTKEIEEFKEIILQDCEIRKTIITENSTKIDLLKEYLKQEFDLSENNIAFVEVNGTGKTQDLLADFLNDISDTGQISICSYYISLWKPKDTDISKKIAYCIKPKPYYHTVELLTRTTGGQTLGYKKENGRVVPVLEKIDNSALQNWGYDDYLLGIKDYVNNITDIKRHFEDVEFCYFYFDYLTTKCYKQIAETVGSVPFLSIGDESKSPEAALKMNVIDFLYVHFTGNIPGKYWAFPYISMARGQCWLQKFMNNKRNSIFFDLWAEIKFYLRLRQLKNKEIMFWGASLFLEDFIKKYNIASPNILGIIDKSSSRQGQTIGKYAIYAPEKINELKPKTVILTIKNNNESIYKSLEKTFNQDFPDVQLEKNIFG